MQKKAVYGLTEISRKEIQGARLVANPGCYPTSIQLPLIPLIKVGLCLQHFISYYVSIYNLLPYFKNQSGKFFKAKCIGIKHA